MARPKGTGKYKEEYDRQAFIACSEGGFTDVTLAKLFGVSKSTINNWKKEYPSFLDSIKKGKDIFDVEVAENCLLKRVTGYQYKETTKALKTSTDTETGEETEELVTTKIVTKSVPPDVTAAIFFLKNRAPERWRDKAEVDHSGMVVVLSKEDLLL